MPPNVDVVVEVDAPAAVDNPLVEGVDKVDGVDKVEMVRLPDTVELVDVLVSEEMVEDSMTEVESSTVLPLPPVLVSAKPKSMLALRTTMLRDRKWGLTLKMAGSSKWW